MAPNWKPEEITLACRAYASATNNGIKGCDQDVETFNKDICEKLKILAGPNVQEGTHYHRGKRVYSYLRDNVFGEIQKFHKAIRLVDVCNPSGVSLDQQLSMAVAIHLGKTNKMDYDYKDFDKKKWKLYEAYLVLRKLPKFAYNFRVNVATTEPNESTGDDDDFLISNIGEDQVPNEVTQESDAIDGILGLSGTSSVSSSSNDENTPIISASAKKRSSRFGSGRDRSKEQAKKDFYYKRKVEVMQENAKEFKMIVDVVTASEKSSKEIKDLMQKKIKLSVLSKAIEQTSDPEKKVTLQKKIDDIVDTLI